MKKCILAFFLFCSFSAIAKIPVGTVAPDFQLKNIDNTTVSLANYSKEKGVVLVFTCNTCPYSIQYEERIIELHKTLAPKGFPVVAIQPNNPQKKPGDSFENMQKRAKEKGYPFSYLKDKDQKTADSYGAKKTPHVYVLKKQEDNSFTVEYVGAIDDNYNAPKKVKQKYVEDVVASLLKGEKPKQTNTKAIGCSIKR